MVELPPGDPRVKAGVDKLMARLKLLMQAESNKPTYDQMASLAKDYRADFKRETGYDFPEVRPFLLPSVGFAAFYRADRDEHSAGREVLLLLRSLAARGFHVSAIEVMSAVNKCWPHVRHLAVEEMRKDRKSPGQLH